MEGGRADQLRLDCQKMLEKHFFQDQPGAEHILNIGKVTGMSTLQLREGLDLGMIMVKIDQAMLDDEETAKPPVRKFQDEVCGAGRFNIYRQLLFH